VREVARILDLLGRSRIGLGRSGGQMAGHGLMSNNIEITAGACSGSEIQSAAMLQIQAMAEEQGRTNLR
jgi:hypothetical protein